MAKRTVNLGTIANDGTGDPLRSAFGKINENFDEAYAQILTADLTYYVSTAGNDSNDGLTVGTPFLTIQKAINTAVDYNRPSAVGNITIQLANGTYSVTTVILRRFSGSGTITIRGDPTTPANVTITTSAGLAVWAYDSASSWYLNGLRLQSSASGTAILSEKGADVYISAIDFSTGFSTHLWTVLGGIIRANGNYSITAGAAQHVTAQTSGSIDVSGRTLTITGTPAFSTAFANVGYIGNANFAGCTFTGSATGSRYSLYANGVIVTGGAAVTFLPGNAGGTAITGGQYA